MEILNAIRPIAALALAAVLSTCNEGCGLIQPSKEPSIADLYAMEVIGCIEKSTTKEASRKCRQDVDRKYGLCPHTEWPQINPCDY